MKKILLIVVVVLSIGVLGAMLANTASAQYFRIPVAPAVVGAGCCCVPVCGPVYACPPAVKAVTKGKAKTAPKTEKKAKTTEKKAKEKK